MVFEIATPAMMEALGAALAQATRSGGTTYFLYGELGTGKTTLVRGFLRCLGHPGAVKSPTFTLVEPYLIGERQVYHFDLYRIAGAEELEGFGIRDYFDGEALCLVEWPDRGAAGRIAPDVEVRLACTERGRRGSVEAGSEKGREVLGRLARSASGVSIRIG